MDAEGSGGRFGLRVRIAMLAALVVGLALALSAVLLTSVLRSRLDSAATTAAQLRATDVAALAAAQTLPETLALPGEESAFVQVIGADGHLVASTENVEHEVAVSDRKPTGDSVLRFTTDVDSRRGHNTMRIVAVNSSTPDGIVTVYAGESLDYADETVGEISAALTGIVPILAFVAGAVTWWAVGRTLRPVRAITTTMGEITATDLHRRVPEPKRHDEIGTLALAVNDTLERLDRSVDRQRRFVADASHELRGPLAALRADLEISVAHPNETSWPTVAADTLSDVERLQHLTEDLLLLARLDAEQPGRRQIVDLTAVVNEALSQVRAPDLVVTASGLDVPAPVAADRDQLHRLVRNLVHNAECHARSDVRVAVSRVGDVIRLTVADDGPGILPADRERVFERFVRLDEARTRDTGGTGLGLAIAHDVASRHGGSIRVDNSATGGALLTVDLPVGRAR